MDTGSGAFILICSSHGVLDDTSFGLLLWWPWASKKMSLIP